MNPLKTLFRLLVSCLLWIFVIYWAIFATFTITLLISSGPERVVHWYMHISTVGFHFDWSWRVFVIRQITNLIITVGLFLLRRQLRGRQPAGPL
jgi:hypothetical protein